MSIWEIALIGVALAADAVAAGMSDGMSEPAMSAGKHVFIAFLFGLFQFLMPLLGYLCGYAFAELVGRIAPWLSFALLAFIGGKPLVTAALSRAKGEQRERLAPRRRAGAGKLFAQAVATSVDALAVGVTLLAAETGGGLPAHIALCALVIGIVTFALSFAAVGLGRRAGVRFSARAEEFGGAVLVLVGLKILLEGIDIFG